MESESAGNGATAGRSRTDRTTGTAMQPEGIASNHVIVSEGQVKVSFSACKVVLYVTYYLRPNIRLSAIYYQLPIEYVGD